MPYKSEAQRKYMHAAADRGEVPRKVVDDFDRATKKFTRLPARVRKGPKTPPHRGKGQ